MVTWHENAPSVVESVVKSIFIGFVFLQCMPVCVWTRPLPKPLVRVIHYISFICEEDYGVLEPIIHSQFQTRPPPSSNLWPVANQGRTLNLQASPGLWEPPWPPPPGRGGDGAHCFTALSVSYVSGQVLFLRLAYTFLPQMVYIPRRGAVLNQLAAPCSWDKVETLSSARSTADSSTQIKIITSRSDLGGRITSPPRKFNSDWCCSRPETRSVYSPCFPSALQKLESSVIWNNLRHQDVS